MTDPVDLDPRRRVQRHPLRALGHRHRQGHHRPARGPQRVPAADRARAHRRLRPHPRRRVHRLRAAHRRGRQGVLLGRRPDVQEPRRRLRGRRRHRPPQRARPPAPDPLAADPGHRARQRLRDRRRPRAPRRVRPVDRVRERDLRPGRAAGSAASTPGSASACWRGSSATRRRRRSGSCAASTRPHEALEMGLVNKVVPLADLEAEGVQWADEILEMSPTAIRFLKSAFLVATDGLAGLQEFAGNATGLYYTTDEAHEGSHGVPREAPARLPQVPAPAVSPTRRPAPRAGPRRPDLARSPAARDAAGRGRRRCSSGSGRPRERGARSGSTRRSAASPSRCCSRSSANFANDLSDFRRGADTADRHGPAARRRGRPRDGAPARGRDRHRDRARRRSSGCGWCSSVGRCCSSLGAARDRRGARLHGRAVPVRLPGLGEVFVFMFFGLVAVVGTAYLQALRLEPLFSVGGDPGRAR